VESSELVYFELFVYVIVVLSVIPDLSLVGSESP